MIWGGGFREKFVAEKVRVISCALLSRGAPSALFGKGEIDVMDPQYQISRALGHGVVAGRICREFTNLRPFRTTG